MSMNPKIKAEWVAALRSGKYVQGKGMLRRESGSYCCLGVLCDLHARANPESGMWIEGVDGWLYESGERSYYALPSEVQQWAGFDQDDVEVVVPGRGVKTDGLAGHNDRGRTFEEIAKAIEEQL